MSEGYANYHARCWAAGRSDAEVSIEIERCEWRYLQPYPWNGVECAYLTIGRIKALWEVLTERWAASPTLL